MLARLRRPAMLMVISAALLCGIQYAPAKAATSQDMTASVDSLLYAPASAVAATEPGSASPLSDQIIAAVSTPEYQAVYGGAQVQSGGSVTVYATASGVSTISAALSSALGASTASDYTVQTAPQTLYNLEADTLQVASSGVPNQFENLSSSPFVVVSFGPDSASGTVRFTILGDANQAQQTLSSMLPNIPISATSTTSLALPEPIAGPSRYYDVVPYYGGDRIDIAGHSGGCTANFNFTGSIHPDNTWSFTANHCSGNGVGAKVTQDTNPDGAIASQYTIGPDGNGRDFASFNCNCSGGFVWYEGENVGTGQGKTHNVSGSCNCYGNGTLVTMDGASSGQRPILPFSGTRPDAIPQVRQRFVD